MALSGSYPSLRDTSSSRRPFTPPAAFTSLKAARMPSRMPRPSAAAEPSRAADWPNSIRLSKTPASEAPGSAPDAEMPKRFTIKISVAAATASRAASAARSASIVSPYHYDLLACSVGKSLFYERRQCQAEVWSAAAPASERHYLRVVCVNEIVLHLYNIYEVFFCAITVRRLAHCQRVDRPPIWHDASRC